MVYRPRCERTSSGCGSLSLMQPIPLEPENSLKSFSNFVRNGVFLIEWISRLQPSFGFQIAMPP